MGHRIVDIIQSSTTKTLLIGVITLGGAIYLSAESAQSGPADGATKEPTVERVEVATVEVATESRELRFSGVTQAARRARLGMALGGRVIERPVEVGDRVSKGQRLARLDDRELKNAVATAEASLAELEARRAQAERDRDRAEQLARAKAATDEELEKTQSAVEALVAAEQVATARLREAQRLLSETRLTAPFDGTVTEVLFEPGEFASPGQPVVVLSGDGAVELEVEVPESVVPHLQQGDTVTVELPVFAGEPLSGRITSVGRTALGAGRLFPVQVTLESGDGSTPSRLAPGVTAELVLALESGGALAVPVEAVVNPGGHRPTLFRVLEGDGRQYVECLPVEVGSLLGNRVIVHGDLAAGDHVVVGGQRGLLDGETVEILTREETPR